MDALGIINFEDNIASIEGLGDYRPVPAISFLGRYRIIDFILSNMTNSGIDNVQVFCKEKPRNLIEHLGTGTHYNINSKRGRLRILYGEKPFSSPVYNTDVANMDLNMQYIEANQNKYVIIAPSYFIYSYDFNEALERHIESGADVSVLCKQTSNAKEEFLGCDIVTVNQNHRIVSMSKNHGSAKNRTISLECYIMDKKTLVSLVKRAKATSSLYWLKDILADMCDNLIIKGINVPGYVGCLNSLSEYYRISMEMRQFDKARQLFKPGWPIHTMTNDSCPTRFTETGSATGSVVANGCVVAGRLENCILGRNVVVKEGAVLKNCIVLADAFIEKDAQLNAVIVDKYAMIEKVKTLEGTTAEPIYVKRRDRI